MDRFKQWLPLIIQTLVFIGGGILYTNSQEHRLTVMEEALHAQERVITASQANQALIIQEIQSTEISLSRLIALEDFLRGLPDDATLSPRYKRPH